jgi:predicted transcriptional regulator
VSPFERLLEKALCPYITDNWRRTREPMRTSILADQIGKHPRTVRSWLVRLEELDKVRRQGQRGGWLPGSVRSSCMVS